MVFFLFLHACTPNVNEPEDDCVPKHGSVKPKRKCRSCLEGGSVHGWFFEVDHSARPHVFGERGAPFSGLGTHCSVISSDSQRRCARTALQDVMTTSCALTSMQGQLSCCAGIISLFFLVYVTVDSHSLVTWTVEVARRFLSAVVMSPEANWSPMKFSCVFHPLAVVCVRSYPALPEALRYQARRRMCRASLPCFTCTPQNGTVCVLTLVCLRWILTHWSRGRLKLLSGFCLRLCCLLRRTGVRCSFRVSSTILLWCVFAVTRRYPRHSGIRLDVACVLLSFPGEKFLCDTCAIFCVLPGVTRGTQAFRLARVVGIHLPSWLCVGTVSLFFLVHVRISL